MLFVVALLIAYGSLYPFNFTAPPEGIVGRLFAEALSGGSRGDILGNIGLFIPWGLLGVLAIAPERAISRTLGIGFLLALGLQVIQVWIPSRTPAMYDAIWNMGGCLIGMVLGHYLRKTAARTASDQTHDQAALWLLGAWILVEWLPLIPGWIAEIGQNPVEKSSSAILFGIGPRANTSVFGVSLALASYRTLRHDLVSILTAICRRRRYLASLMLIDLPSAATFQQDASAASSGR